MTARKRKRLKYTSSYVDRHGKERWVFRRAGYSSCQFTAPHCTPDFAAEYDTFMASPITPEKVIRRKVRPRSIDDLLCKFYASNDYRGKAQIHVLSKRRAVLDHFADSKGEHGGRYGGKLVATIDFIAVDKIIARTAIKKEDGSGGPFAAQFLKKQLTRLLKYARKIRWITTDPMEFVEYRAAKTTGFHSITENEIEQYRATHPLGTNARLAMELLLWTGKRRSDGRILGRQNMRDGMMWGRDQKTGKEWWLVIAPQLQQAIDAMPPHNHLPFLVSSLGKPYSAASLGNMFRKWFNRAGLPHCTAHGLRKAISRRMADELGMGNAGIKSITLHTGDAEVSVYTAAADQKRMARVAIERLSKWELSNRAERNLSNQTKKA